MAETVRVEWTDPRGDEAPAIGKLIRASTYGATPCMSPASNGIRWEDGSLRFTDWKGEIVTAQIGDVIEVTDQGWVLCPAQDGKP